MEELRQLGLHGRVDRRQLLAEQRDGGLALLDETLGADLVLGLSLLVRLLADVLGGSSLGSKGDGEDAENETEGAGPSFS